MQLATNAEFRSAASAEVPYQRNSHLDRFGGVEDIGEFRRPGWRDARDVRVGNVVIAAIQEIQNVGPDAPLTIKLIAEPGV